MHAPLYQWLKYHYHFIIKSPKKKEEYGMDRSVTESGGGDNRVREFDWSVSLVINWVIRVNPARCQSVKVSVCDASYGRYPMPVVQQG